VRELQGLVLISKKRLTVRAHAPAAVDLVADVPRLRRVLGNLVGNAIRFTIEGTVTVSARRVGDRVHIVVADTGVGIPPEELSAIFDQYRRVADTTRAGDARSGGHGLGLAIAKQLAELHGGTLACESTLGKGSTFTLELPVPDS